jgi:hypothetical protein
MYGKVSRQRDEQLLPLVINTGTNEPDRETGIPFRWISDHYFYCRWFFEQKR